MKYATIIGVVLFIIVVGVIMSRSGDEITPTPVIPETTSNETLEETTPGVTDDEHNDTLTGNDLGMEYPNPDQPISSTDSVALPGAAIFTVKGTDFAYDVTEIRVKEGDTVIINFESEAGFHDWVVDEFAARTEKVRTGGKTSVTFVADKAGTYEYYCSVGSHRANGMIGKLIVE